MLLPILLACSAPDAVTKRAAASGDSASDSASDTGPQQETAVVAHTRELRALYVATVWNIDWPSSYQDDATSQQAEVTALLDRAATAGMNAVVIQVRPEGDALYRSSIEPWSRWLTGTQGKDPGYDPLDLWISEAHSRGIEVHAWINPFRAKSGSESTSGLVAGHMAHDFPEYAYAYDGDLWMDPGATVVHTRVTDVVSDLIGSYDLDGVHVDDYFYPYPGSEDFPDDATYAAYTSAGGALARDDWRRANTAQMIEELHDTIAAQDPSVRFGVAPFGIWRPGTPSGITGFDAYEGLYADPLAWLDWVDYLAPQLYWETENSGQEYAILAEWWDAQMTDTNTLMPANNLSAYATTSTWSLDEYAAQIDIGRGLPRTGGNLWYSASPLIDGADELLEAFASRYYPTPALPPEVHALDGTTEPMPTLTLNGRRVSWDAQQGRRAITVYKESAEGWTLDRIVPADQGSGGQGSVELAAGRWALASVARGDVESLGVVVTVP